VAGDHRRFTYAPAFHRDLEDVIGADLHRGWRFAQPVAEQRTELAGDLLRRRDQCRNARRIVMFAEMLRRLETDPQWAREYEDFVRSVSFAGPGDVIGFGDAYASCNRLVAAIRRRGNRDA
jgi:hypothetical protein